MIFHSDAAIELQFETESICVLLIGVIGQNTRAK